MAEGTLGEGTSPLDKAKPDASLTDFDKRVFESLRKVLWIPDDFKEYMTQYQALNQPPISISQVFGFSQFTAQTATKINTTQTTTSTSYTNLATVGPELTGLPDGRYLILHGCQIRSSVAGTGALMSVQVNATAATDDDAVATGGTEFYSVATAITKTLANGGNNTITAKYRVGGAATGSFATRWLIALRYANT